MSTVTDSVTLDVFPAASVTTTRSVCTPSVNAVDVML
jgi:hypothetical protein